MFVLKQELCIIFIAKSHVCESIKEYKKILGKSLEIYKALISKGLLKKQVKIPSVKHHKVFGQTPHFLRSNTTKSSVKHHTSFGQTPRPI